MDSISHLSHDAGDPLRESQTASQQLLTSLDSTDLATLVCAVSVPLGFRDTLGGPVMLGQ